MNCPKCEASMERVTYHDIEVYRCTNCKGIWFDMLKEERLKKIKGSEAIDIGDPEKGKAFNQLDQVNCPVCNVQMIKMVDPKQHHLWYEKCPICFGLFFDAGEFKDYKKENFFDVIKDFFTGERR